MFTGDWRTVLTLCTGTSCSEPSSAVWLAGLRPREGVPFSFLKVCSRLSEWTMSALSLSVLTPRSSVETSTHGWTDSEDDQELRVSSSREVLRNGPQPLKL